MPISISEIIIGSFRGIWSWVVFMAAGVVVGVWFFPDLYSRLIPVVENIFGNFVMGSDGQLLAPSVLIRLIFLKNLQTAVLCFLTARITFGILPGLILFFNGVLIGVLAVFLHQDGLSYSSFVLHLLPHGIFELPALFLACAIGMYGVRLNGWKALLLPLFMLAIAAAVEVLISPKII